MVDASHGNSGKDHTRQLGVADSLAEQLAGGEHGLAGVMLESPSSSRAARTLATRRP